MMDTLFDSYGLALALALFFVVLLCLLWIGMRLKRSKPKAAIKVVEPKANLWKRVKPVLMGQGRLPDDWQTRLEESLLAADVGYNATTEILNSLKGAPERPESFEQSREILGRQIMEILQKPLRDKADRFDRRHVCLIVGVNGSGKTTTIVKLARYLQGLKKKVLLAACDTFRAGAVSQLEILAERAGCDLIKGQPKQSPSAVLFDALRAFEAQGYDSLLVDTAGRLHTKTPLIEELKKMKRVAQNANVSVLAFRPARACARGALAAAEAFSQDLRALGVFGMSPFQTPPWPPCRVSAMSKRSSLREE